MEHHLVVVEHKESPWTWNNDHLCSPWQGTEQQLLRKRYFDENVSVANTGSVATQLLQSQAVQSKPAARPRFSPCPNRDSDPHSDIGHSRRTHKRRET